MSEETNVLTTPFIMMNLRKLIFSVSDLNDAVVNKIDGDDLTNLEKYVIPEIFDRVFYFDEIVSEEESAL